MLSRDSCHEQTEQRQAGLHVVMYSESDASDELAM
jgi:hypothetical protein